MESGATDIDSMLDTSYPIEEAGQAFGAFLNSETCKPVFNFTQ